MPLLYAYWFGPYKRSCVYQDVELVLRYLALGHPEPWEAPAEEAQGFGRQCMRLCMGLTSKAKPLHNVCALECFAHVKSSAHLSNEQMLADYEQHEKDAMREKAPVFRAVLAELDTALAYELPADFESWWVQVDDAGAEEQ